MKTKKELQQLLKLAKSEIKAWQLFIIKLEKKIKELGKKVK